MVWIGIAAMEIEIAMMKIGSDSSIDSFQDSDDF